MWKVCVYSVCKNEEKFVERWVDSMNEADMIIVTDTGSTDNTVEKLRARGVIVYIDVIKPWRFDKARNSCLPHIPEDVDICVSTDMDEVFEPGWRKNLEKAWTKETKRAHYHFTWSFQKDGSPGVTFMYDRIHARKDYEWVNPTHESLHYLGNDPEIVAWCPDVRLKHYPDLTKDRSFNLPLLELAVAERPDDPRNYHYLGREYMYAGMWDKCIETLEKLLLMPNFTWKEERASSMRFIARAKKAKGDIAGTKAYYYLSINEAPYLREPYVEMAKLMYEQQDWPGVYHMAMDALNIKQRSTYINEIFSWDSTIYDLASLGCYYLGMKDKALEYAKTAMKMDPENARLRGNYELIKSEAGRQVQNAAATG